MSAIPSGIRKFTTNPGLVLLVTQFFSTMAYAVLYSTLVLYMTQKLHMSSLVANTLMGLFLAFNFALHLLGSYMGGRLLSYRNLFLIGMGIQIVACAFFSIPSISALYIAIALYLTGSGLNVPCINMMLTQQFEPESTQRETAFIWNYAGMNVGFLIGFTIAGYFQLKMDYHTLFLLTIVTNVIASIIILSGWRAVKDHTTPLSKKENHPSIVKRKGIFGIIVITLVFIALLFLLRYASATNIFILSIGIFMFLLFIYLALIQPNLADKKRIFAYVILSIAGLVFWSLYQLGPMALTLFAQYNINRHIFGLTFPPQWIQNINTIIIALGGIVLPPFFKKIRKFINFSYPLQFACSLIFIALGFLLLTFGIQFAAPNGTVNFTWIALSYVLQSLGELFIGPVGYAMIGLLATEKLQGLMMGSWMLISGGTSGVIASYLSNYAIQDSTTNNPAMTNPGYSHMFLSIGVIALIAGLILFCLVPFLMRLIGLTQKHSAN